jgi:hypothetical protein
LVVALLALVQADRIEARELFVTPSERVSRFVDVRELSSSDSDVIARLGPGERLPLMDSGPGWREVRLDDGRSGSSPSPGPSSFRGHLPEASKSSGFTF